MFSAVAVGRHSGGTVLSLQVHYVFVVPTTIFGAGYGIMTKNSSPKAHAPGTASNDINN